MEEVECLMPRASIGIRVQGQRWVNNAMAQRRFRQTEKLDPLPRFLPFGAVTAEPGSCSSVERN